MSEKEKEKQVDFKKLLECESSSSGKSDSELPPYKLCTCDIIDVWNLGCRCGGFASEQARKKRKKDGN